MTLMTNSFGRGIRVLESTIYEEVVAGRCLIRRCDRRRDAFPPTHGMNKCPSGRRGD